MKVAVVGAGLAGLSCARVLREHGVECVVFDKGRAPGGRLATRRIDAASFDLGAQYFTVRDARFADAVRAWEHRRVVGPWTGRIGSIPARGGSPSDTGRIARWVGTPSMSSIARHLARDLEVRTSQRVDLLERTDRGWRLRGTVASAGTTLGQSTTLDPSTELLGDFDHVVICLPPAQAHDLVATTTPRLAATLAGIAMDPCIALGFVPTARALDHVSFDGLFVGRDGDRARVISWIARDGSKPQRGAPDTWVVHAAPEWSREHLRDADDVLERALLEELARLLVVPAVRTTVTTLQRWRYARAPAPLDARTLADVDAKIAVGGDWLAGGRIEGAVLSGLAAAEHVLGGEATTRVAAALQ